MIRYCSAKIAASSPPNVVAIGDFGCGEARLAATLRSDKSLKAQHRIHSFDLVAANSLITACDIAKVPLNASSLDIAVFCLSLMGTNFEDFLLEARRTLKIGGHLLIAEVQSRLPSVQQFVDMCAGLGFSMVVKVCAACCLPRFPTACSDIANHHYPAH